MYECFRDIEGLEGLGEGERVRELMGKGGFVDAGW